MAARWGAGEETLTIGGMELFTAGGPLQRHHLEEDETCDGLSDLALSSLDAGGILGTFQGYIDNSIISIINDPGTSAEQKDNFDEENELSLLTALTEILDNAEDENISPFDIIPDTELLVSPKDRDGSMMFLALSRTPPEHEIFSVSGQRRADSNKIDSLYSGPNWELFPDIISSTPNRRHRRISVRGCLHRRAEAKENNQRSDGEDEDVPCPGKIAVKSGLLAVDDNISKNTETDSNDGDREQILMQRTPCIINTENVALKDLVKYMHPYCLPAISVCLESEEDDNLLGDAVVLEIVSEQGECIKVPVVVEPPVDMLCTESSDNTEGMDDETENIPNRLPSSEECVPELAVHNEKKVDLTEKSGEVDPEPMENYGAGPKVPDTCSQPPSSDILDKSPNDHETCKSKEIVPDCKKNGEPVIAVPEAKEKVPPKGKRSSKDKQHSKSKGKSKMKSVPKGKTPDAAELIAMQSITQPPACRVSNPSLQESDFLTKTLDQVKESQMELRSSKIGRTKLRTRESFDGFNPEMRSAARKVKPVGKESAPINNGIGGVDGDKDLESNPKLENSKPEESQDAEVEGLQSEGRDVNEMLVASDICSGEEPSSYEESGASKLDDVPDGDCLQLNKETKPKLLSLSEYRKRLQHRKPNLDRDNENQSCSKWPSVPEPPTELAELPCLIVPTLSNKSSVEEKACLPKKHSHVSGQDVPVSSASFPNAVIPTPVANQDVQQLKEKPCQAVIKVIPPPMITPQPTMPPSFLHPAWPTVPPHPSFYPGMPPLAGVHYPNIVPLLPPPPPVMGWPQLPPIAVPPVHPTSWVSPYWPNAQMAQGVFESQSFHSPHEKSVRPNPHMLSEQKIMQETIVAPVESRPQAAVLPIHRTAVPKPDNGVGQQQPKTAAKLESVSHVKSSTPDGPQVRPGLTSSLPMKTDKSLTAAPSKIANVPIPDLQSANKVVYKVMEILKKAQKLGFQLKPSSNSVIGNTQLGVQVPPSAAALKPAQPKLADVKGQIVDKSPTEETSAAITDESSMLEPVAAGSRTAQKVAEDELPASCIGSKQEAKAPVVFPRAETLCTSEESLQRTAESDLKEPEEGFSCESGIEASDLTSLLEQFEKSEAKEEERLSQSPDKLAVGNSWTQKTLGKKIPDKFLPPELVNTAGLTPPATPPHQLWKPLGAGAPKSKALQGRERTRSPLKTTKLIEPLPQSRLKNRSVSSVAAPAIHVASGDHDYCILTNQCAKSKTSAPAAASPAPQCEEGSRWNVKHHQNITIKPIVQFNRRQQNTDCPKPPAPSAHLAVANQSTTYDPVRPMTPCDGIQKATSAPLDHRTNVLPESAVTSPPASVLMSPDSSPCRGDDRENRTDLKRGSAPVSRRALRCYRKYKGSPSPQESSRRGRSSGSRSDSRSSSSSSSRSRSPAVKRRRTSRYRSRSRHRSRSSSRSSYGSSSSSRSSSRSSRSCSSPSSRSRSPFRRRCRSRRCESRDSYNRRRMYHKERAIEERRVVYIGKINSLMTRSELRRRFSVFGEIEECTIHFREEGDNYGFVTYGCTRDAFAAIDNGHKLCLPDELPFDLCFGGRRQFCRSTYADLDSNRDDFDPASVRSKCENLDFDTLLKQAQKSHRR